LPLGPLRLDELVAKALGPALKLPRPGKGVPPSSPPDCWLDWRLVPGSLCSLRRNRVPKHDKRWPAADAACAIAAPMHGKTCGMSFAA